MITDAKIAGKGKPALSIKIDIAFKTNCSASKNRGFLQRVIQQNFTVAFSFQFWRNTDWPHCHDRNLSAVIGFNIRSHKHILSNQLSSLLHNEIQFGHKCLIVSKLIQYIMF